MGHAASNWLLQISEFGGTYSNPYKRSGEGIKYTKWKTIGGTSYTSGGLNGAKKLWLEHYQQRDPAKVVRYRVRFKGKTVIDHQGCVYEIVTQIDHSLGGSAGRVCAMERTSLRFVEQLV